MKNTSSNTQALEDFLEKCDQAALDNVRAGQGGPFAASLHLRHVVADSWITVVPPCCNAVLKTGLSSAHAESCLIAESNIEKLKNALADHELDSVEIYLVSSAESCPACHAKLEVLARRLVHDGYLAPGRFHVVYGATYEETESIAGFSDAPYHQDFQKDPGTGLVKQICAIPGDSLLSPVESIIRREHASCAVVLSGKDIVTATGHMSETRAIQKMSQLKKDRGDSAPWDLSGSVLYTRTRSIGPVAYAECQWAHIGQWITVDDGGDAGHPEAPDISNHDLFRVVATRPYTHPQSALRFLRIQPFANLAQKEWRKLAKLGHLQTY